MKPEVVLAAVVTINGVMAPYEMLQCTPLKHLPHFQSMMSGCPVIMGRKTNEWLKDPYLGSRSIVLTRSLEYAPALSETSRSLTEALERLRDYPRVIIMGGVSVIHRAFSLADRLCITQVNSVIAGHRYFPDIDHREWIEISRSDLMHSGSGQMAFRLIEYVRENHDH